MNAVIAPFKEPLPCQDTMEWPFCDCKPLLVVNHSGQSHGPLHTVPCCCHSNYVIQVLSQHHCSLVYFKRQKSMLSQLKQHSGFISFLAVHTVSLFLAQRKTLPGHQLGYSPSGFSLKEWQFSTRLFELLIFCGSPSVTSGCTGNTFFRHRVTECSPLYSMFAVNMWVIVWAVILIL